MACRLAVISGGLGGARVARALRLAGLLDETVFVVNVADDLVHLGLHVSPDVDSVLYSIWGTFDFDRGWGRTGETYRVSEELATLGSEQWFQLGDRDLGLHLRRHSLLTTGSSLSEAMSRICEDLGLDARVVPASNDPIRTRVTTGGEEVDFQTYHVAMGGHPAVDSVRYAGLDVARPAPGVLDAIREAETILLAPSSPVASLAPILGMEGLDSLLRERRERVVAMSPVLLSAAPATPSDQHHWRTRSNLLRGIGVEHHPCAIAEHLRDVAGTIVIDQRDRDVVDSMLPDQRVVFGDTVLTCDDAGGAIRALLVDLGHRPLSYTMGSA